MREYYLAIDIGAASGRHILGYYEDGKLQIEEIYRFSNGIKNEDGCLLWDTELIFQEICSGLKKCKELGKLPKTVGIDTWGVDYVLLDDNFQLIGKTYAYRDSRTTTMVEELEKIFSTDELYQRCGIQKMPINTIYQLMAHKKQKPDELARARYFLMMADYFHWLLSGVISNEYTNSSTSQLIDIKTKDWDRELIRKLGIDDKIFGPLSLPGKKLGEFTEDIRNEVGYSCSVVLPATHDTGSAFMAVPALNDNSVFLSSGTWSLMGCEITEPITTEKSRELNYTNEGGYDYSYRYLKNIMGLWMLQSIRQELPETLSYEELGELASAVDTTIVLDCKDNRFLAPVSMIKEIQQACQEQGFPQPQSAGELTAIIYNSLATCYKKTFEELALLTNKQFTNLHIVGGGCKDKYLNAKTAKALAVPVLVGPEEATAIGNILAQMLTDGVFTSLKEARLCVKTSFSIEEIS